VRDTPVQSKMTGCEMTAGSSGIPTWMHIASRDIWQALWRIRFERIHQKKFFEVNLRGCNGD
jgi:hypothetical protein